MYAALPLWSIIRTYSTLFGGQREQNYTLLFTFNSCCYGDPPLTSFSRAAALSRQAISTRFGPTRGFRPRYSTRSCLSITDKLSSWQRGGDMRHGAGRLRSIHSLGGPRRSALAGRPDWHGQSCIIYRRCQGPVASPAAHAPLWVIHATLCGPIYGDDGRRR